MDKSLSQWKYNKQTHVDVLSEYKDFLSKNGLEDSAGEIQTRIDIMQKEIDEKSKKISELWSKISKLLKSLISTITPLMIHEIKISFIEINKLAYEIGYDKVEHELILQEYRKFLKNIGLKREADVIGKDIEILRTGYDKNVFMATLSEYRDSFLELGFKDDAKSMQEIIDVMSK
ncbi:hypothetical protein J6T66_01430 [bacterium]|nr:hypothetical protein [bacterium]